MVVVTLTETQPPPPSSTTTLLLVGEAENINSNVNKVEAPKKKKKTACPNCRSDQIEHDSTQGNSVCQACGTVLEENAVVAEVTFAELASGASVLQGQFISAETGSAPAPSIFGRRLDGGGGLGQRGESRAATILNGRRRIQAVAWAVGMTSEHYIEAAQRWFVLALQHQFTRGRRAPNIAAACLYIVCRQERTPHMLLDFADVLQTSVYALGGTFLRLVRLLNLEMPLIDPSFYVGRFAARLEFGERTQAVANTALRVVARMKRDWIQTGRRPAGVCAAGLIIAARMHGFRRTERQVVQVVRICEATLRKRLEEFGDTPSSQLTPEEFEGIWLEQEHDPPSYLRSASSLKAREMISAAESTATELNVQRVSEFNVPPTVSEMPLTPPPSQPQSAIVVEPQSLSDLDNDEEVNSFLLDTDEVSIKTRIWTSLNREYLEKEAAKVKEEETAAAAASCCGEQKEPPPPPPPQVKKRKPREPSSTAKAARGEPAAQTAALAAKQMLVTKKFSKKINYAALDELFGQQ